MSRKGGKFNFTEELQIQDGEDLGTATIGKPERTKNKAVDTRDNKTNEKPAQANQAQGKAEATDEKRVLNQTGETALYSSKNTEKQTAKQAIEEIAASRSEEQEAEEAEIPDIDELAAQKSAPGRKPAYNERMVARTYTISPDLYNHMAALVQALAESGVKDDTGKAPISIAYFIRNAIVSSIKKTEAMNGPELKEEVEKNIRAMMESQKEEPTAKFKYTM